ncbi:MAG: PilZ domain-containing protein [Planctomycetota bacterium]|jgi:c-di-GMP-binding flagellar brake protein YcgR|nr:PilZ domain-containing protein [Planctomycetota bacterium]
MPEYSPGLPLAVSDGYHRLPGFETAPLFTPTVVITLFVFAIAIVVMAYLSYRNRIRRGWERREEALRLAEKKLRKSGGDQDDVDRFFELFDENPKIEPGDTLILKDKFKVILRPVIDKKFGSEYGERLESLFFPPSREGRITAMIPPTQSRVDAFKSAAGGKVEATINLGPQTPAGILDLMDATLRPGVMLRLNFAGAEGGYNCLVMGHDLKGINVTLPANNDKLLSILQSGTAIEGTVESGSTLLAFTSEVIQAVAGSMPYCRIAAWCTAWEVRKRQAMRLPISLDLDFQHIPTGDTETIHMASINNRLGAIRPGRMVDISVGGCCLESPSSSKFDPGDIARFSKSLMEGMPPATFLGSIVKVDPIDKPEEHEGSRQRLHIQFLLVDDVSQRLLLRAVKHIQEAAEQNEWVQAQRLMQQMRRNNIPMLGSPGGPYGARIGTNIRNTTTVKRRSQETMGRRTDSTRSRLRSAAKPPTREMGKPPTRGINRPDESWGADSRTRHRRPDAD